VAAPPAETSFRRRAEAGSGGFTLRKRSVGFLALTFFLGILVGSVMSQVIGLFFTEGSTAHQLFVQYLSFGFGPTDVNLLVADVTLGLHIHVNLMSAFGVFIVAQLLRWVR